MAFDREKHAPDYRDLPRRELERRRARNPRYSLRAFALFLGVSRTALSASLAKKRHLSPRNRSRVAKRVPFHAAMLESLSQGR